MNNRRALQVAVAILALVPISAGLAGVLLGAGMTGPHPVDPALDSHLRYLSGLLLGIGLAFWFLVPTIERRGALFGVLTAIVFAGGLARLFGVVLHGLPPAPMLFGLVMELVVTPFLWLWQRRVARFGAGAAEA